MSYYTYNGSGARTVKAKGDIRDVITRLDVDQHPLWSTLPREGARDIKVSTLEDALASVNTDNAYAEGAPAPAAEDTSRSEVYNHMQLMLSTAAVSDTQNAVAQYGMGQELLYQEAKKLLEIMRNAEALLVSDQAKQALSAANGRKGLVAGMSNLISSHTTATFSQSEYDSLIGDIVEDGGNPRVAYLSRTSKEAVSDWTTNLTRFTNEAKSLEREVLIYHAAMGDVVEFNYHPFMPQDKAASAAELLLIDPSLWVLKELQPLFRKSLPDTGGGPSTLFKWQWSVLCLAEKGNGQINS